jgi:hypothetical protein
VLEGNRGIIVNVDNFNGKIEMIGNEIKNNHVFIPSAILSNFVHLSDLLPIELLSINNFLSSEEDLMYLELTKAIKSKSMEEK